MRPIAIHDNSSDCASNEGVLQTLARVVAVPMFCHHWPATTPISRSPTPSVAAVAAVVVVAASVAAGVLRVLLLLPTLR